MTRRAVCVPARVQASHLIAAYAFDIDARVRHGRARPHIYAEDVNTGVVLDEDGVVVRVAGAAVLAPLSA